MADEKYKVPDNPEYNPEIRAIRNSDPVKASTVLNPVIEKLVENIHAVHQAAEKAQETAEAAGEGAASAIADSDKGAPGGVATLDEDGKVPAGQLPGMDYDPGGSARVVQEALEDHAGNQGNPHGVTAAQAGSVPKERKVNGKPLEADITLDAEDVGADAAGSAAAVKSELENALGNHAKDTGLHVTTVKQTEWNTAASTASKALEIANAAKDVAEGMQSYVIQIHFLEFEAGTEYTVTGADFSHTGTVPNNDVVIGVKVPYANLTYTITCFGRINVTTQITTASTYGNYATALSYPLDMLSWEQINRVANKGHAEKTWKLGDIKNITLKSGELLTMYICGFEHDELEDESGYARLTFGTKNLMKETKPMHSEVIKGARFPDTDLFNWITGDLVSLLPDDAHQVLKSVNKLIGQNSSTVFKVPMKVFLFSACELGYTPQQYLCSIEGTRYPVFTDNLSRIKHLNNGSGEAWRYWTRSASLSESYSGCFGQMPASGIGGIPMTPVDPWGICFGFCV